MLAQKAKVYVVDTFISTFCHILGYEKVLFFSISVTLVYIPDHQYDFSYETALTAHTGGHKRTKNNI